MNTPKFRRCAIIFVVLIISLLAGYISHEGTLFHVYGRQWALTYLRFRCEIGRWPNSEEEILERSYSRDTLRSMQKAYDIRVEVVPGASGKVKITVSGHRLWRFTESNVIAVNEVECEGMKNGRFFEK